MLYRNILWLSLLLLLTPRFSPGLPARATEQAKWVINEDSSLCVNGSTNINTFACVIAAYDQKDTIIIKGRGNHEITLSGSIGLRVQSFDCHNAMMTHDLRKTLKEKEFPMLHISFLSLSKLPELSAKPEAITGLVNIELAGTRKRFEVNYRVSVDGQKVIHLLGTRDINFTDFNLVPPRKLGGMIKTNDKLSVVFHLRMTAASTQPLSKGEGLL
jgi:hypothetical protein